MIRPQSLQHTYTEFYSGDEAFCQLPAKPTDEEKEEHARRWSVARETGNFAELAIEGVQPTAFELRPVPGDIFRKLVDMGVGGEIGPAQFNALLFRAALVGVTNLQLPSDRGHVAAKVKFVNHPALGKIADIEVANALDRVDFKIITELAGLIRERCEAVSPKS